MKTASDRSIDNQLVDGLRLDTAKHVGKSFWAYFTSAAGVFSTGEVFDPDAGFVCDYQNHMPSVLNYPAYYAFNSFLSSTSGNTRSLLNAISNLKYTCVNVCVSAGQSGHTMSRVTIQGITLPWQYDSRSRLWSGVKKRKLIRLRCYEEGCRPKALTP
jgi:alpha-amylase